MHPSVGKQDLDLIGKESKRPSDASPLPSYDQRDWYELLIEVGSPPTKDVRQTSDRQSKLPGGV